MAPYGEPDWTTTSNAQTATVQQPQQLAPTTANAAAGSTNNFNAAEDKNKARTVIAILSLFDILLAVGMSALGVLTILEFRPSKVTDLTLPFLGGYMVIFAALLFVYEIIWWQPLPYINKAFRKNFGFLYGLRGKGFYMICIAFLCLGPLNRAGSTRVQWLDWCTGGLWMIFGILHLLCGFMWPTANDVYRPPIVVTNHNNNANNGNVNAAPTNGDTNNGGDNNAAVFDNQI